LSGVDLYEEPISFSLLPYYLPFNVLTVPAARFVNVWCHECGSTVRDGEPDHNTDKQSADENCPSSHLAVAPYAIIHLHYLPSEPAGMLSARDQFHRASNAMSITASSGNTHRSNTTLHEQATSSR